ncbi:MAG: endonuclease III [Bacteroidota bacterium]
MKKVQPETKTEQKRRMKMILSVLSKDYPDVHIQLDFGTPFELLVSTILSAQCTDARVNIITKELFIKYRKPKDYLTVDVTELEQDIFSAGYYKAKARHIQGAAEMVIDKFKGKVPSTEEELLQIPGVGRKTANVILGHCFSVPAIVVDTHVSRIIERLGFTEGRNPEKTERILMELIPKDQWVVFTHYLINHGRKVCTSRKAKCGECNVSRYCPFPALNKIELNN